jgi:hypothetical protein
MHATNSSCVPSIKLHYNTLSLQHRMASWGIWSTKHVFIKHWAFSVILWCSDLTLTQRWDGAKTLIEWYLFLIINQVKFFWHNYLGLQLEVWLGEKFQNSGKRLNSVLIISSRILTTFCERKLGNTSCPWLYEYYRIIIQEFVATINMDINFKFYI